jgi:predicted SAM-dependent methyltransferase
MEERKLHLGGKQASPGWTIVDIENRPEVDLVSDIRTLPIASESVSEIYASHVVEHLPFAGVGDALDEFARVLLPGGRLRIAVPDLDTILSLMSSKLVSTVGVYELTRFVYGGQTNEHDYHRSGFNFETLSAVLEQKGFREIRRVGSFGLFLDCSEIRFLGVPISLNVEAIR